MVKDGRAELNLEDEIIRETLVAHDGEVTNPRLRELLGLESLTASEPPNEEAAESAAD